MVKCRLLDNSNVTVSNIFAFRFTEFSAEIQRSIIATSECKARIERKYNKKSRAARVSKDLRASLPHPATVTTPAVPSPGDGLSQSAPSSVLQSVLADRPGRPRKHDKLPKVLSYCQLGLLT